jgi:uncharacterized protein (TIGR01244 family)
MNLHRLDDRLAVSDAPTTDDLTRLHAAGFRSLVDLRADGEPRPRGLAPWEEARLAAAAGLAYRQVPVEPPRLGDQLAAAVRQAVRESPPPVLLHCTSGRRAGVFGLLILAGDQGLSLDACLERGRALGLDFDGMPRLTAFLRRWVSERGGRAAGPPAPPAGGARGL